jgi:uncharacterized protein YecE (DUF72 family)
MTSGDLFAPGPDDELPPAPDRRILIGTSGYSFADWVGPFYPRGTRPSDFLAYYARHFDAVEVNSTYYGIPDPRVLERMERKTPPGFRFFVKLNQAMTHERVLEPARLREFRAAIAPLKAAGKYEGLLAQFPWGFRRTPANESHLSALRGALPEEPLFVEFRHDSWAGADLGDFLRSRQLGFCAVDEPALPGLMPPLVLVTGEDAYVRFHGRNARNWWRGSPPTAAVAGTVRPSAAPPPDRAPAPGARPVSGDRYDHDYSAGELAEWVHRVRELAELARRTYLFFNNCHAGQAARSAKLMQQLLRQQNLPA